jgi:hypothetical protein
VQLGAEAAPPATMPPAVQEAGFAEHPVGTLLYRMVQATVGFIQFCLVILTVSYYNNDDDCGGWTLEPEYQTALLAFEIVWGVGIVFMFAIKIPQSLRLHFWARAPLASAEYVRVWGPTDKRLFTTDTRIEWLSTTATAIGKATASVMNTLYSDVTLLSDKSGAWEVCRVDKTASGGRYITYRLNQLIFSADTQTFVPASVPMPVTVGGLLASEKGLLSSTATARLELVGPNVIAVPEPDALATISTEFNKGFYTYQVFMSWTWFNFSYW